MRKIGKMCSLILIFANKNTNILWINLHTTFILQNFIIIIIIILYKYAN